MSSVQNFHPKMIPQQLCTYSDASQLIVTSLEGPLLFYSIPVIPGGIKNDDYCSSQVKVTFNSLSMTNKFRIVTYVPNIHI